MHFELWGNVDRESGIPRKKGGKRSHAVQNHILFSHTAAKPFIVTNHHIFMVSTFHHHQHQDKSFHPLMVEAQ